MRGQRVGMLAVLFVVVFGATSCREGAPPSTTSSELAPAGDALVPSTDRGLAAGLLTHLPADELTFVGGSEEGSSLNVMVEMSQLSLETVHLYVQQAGSDLVVTSCGMDAGYERVSCETEPNFVEVITRRNASAQMPALMGRYYDQHRGSVLIQVWGSDSADARDLVEDLLADPLLGAQTTTELNEQGQMLPEFRELQSFTTMSIDPPEGLQPH